MTIVTAKCYKLNLTKKLSNFNQKELERNQVQRAKVALSQRGPCLVNMWKPDVPKLDFHCDSMRRIVLSEIPLFIFSYSISVYCHLFRIILLYALYCLLFYYNHGALECLFLF